MCFWAIPLTDAERYEKNQIDALQWILIHLIPPFEAQNYFTHVCQFRNLLLFVLNQKQIRQNRSEIKQQQQQFHWRLQKKMNWK